MVDVFEEVEGQIRSDRYKTLALKALPWIIAIAVAALAATIAYWGYTTWRDRESAGASQAYARALDTAASGETDQAFVLFGQVAEDGPPVYRTLALMQQAGIRVEQDRIADAVKLFDAAAEGAPGETLADIARLKSALALLDTAPYAELEQRLAPLTGDERPYRMQAKEALAFAKLMAGDTAEARTEFGVLTVSPDASDPMRQRAAAARGIIDSGSAKVVHEAVKAAATAPDQPVPDQSGAAQ